MPRLWRVQRATASADRCPILTTGLYKNALPSMIETHSLTRTEESEMIHFVHTLPRPLDWELFATITFRRRRDLFGSSHMYHRWMDCNLPRVSHFWAVERNPSGDGGYHIHALWAGTEDLQRTQVWKKAFNHFGVTRITPIVSNSDVTMYCTKYVTKENAIIDWKLNKGCAYQLPLPPLPKRLTSP